MLKFIQLLSPILIIFILSCNESQNRTFSIKDFSDTLQPTLAKLVTDGFVFYDDTLLTTATETELVWLMQSEHPILRAMAFREIGNRKSIHQFDILMKHLDDTALVPTDHGEFGIWFRTVSDDILQEAVWNTQEEKNKTIEQVLTKHNYLESAYRILLYIEPQEKYYSVIRDMATRPRRLEVNGYELDFDDIEYALYGLARFKKAEDRHIIRKSLSENVWQLSHISLRLMKEFPDTGYSEIFQQYHVRKFYRFPGNRRGGFTGFAVDRADPEDFIEALVAQETNWSAVILDTMLNRLPNMTCMPDAKNICDDVVMAIWENPSKTYAKLRQKIKPRAEKILEGILRIELDSSYIPRDTTVPEIRWEF